MKLHLVFDISSAEEEGIQEILENLADPSDRDEQADDLLHEYEFEVFREVPDGPGYPIFQKVEVNEA